MQCGVSNESSKMKLCLIFVSWLVLVSTATGQSPKNGLGFNFYVCTSPGNCQPEPTTLITDYAYTCDNQITCNQTLPEEEYEKVIGLTSDGEQMTFTHKGSGARVFMLSGDKYRMVYLLNRELSFDVDMSTVGCGLNAALGLTQMPADGGQEEFGYAGASFGTGFCDGHENPPNCIEMDIIEANSLATMITVHPCNGTKCSEYGCGLNVYPLGEKNFYGRGSNYTVDTTIPFKIVTRFVTSDGTDDGELKEIQQLFVQNGQVFSTPQVEGGFSAVSDEFCEYHYIPTLPPGNEDYFKGVTAGMTPGMRKGMVLTFSLWGDQDDTYMWWLDQEPYGPCPIYSNPNPVVTYSNVKFGPIGSTL